jgi:predicted ArsR family transcriptional regulator
MKMWSFILFVCLFDANILHLQIKQAFTWFILNYFSMPTSKTPDKILMYLKMNGPQSASDLAKNFGMTSEGMRLHLLKLEENGMITSIVVPKGVGRPTTLFELTQKATKNFPDNHAGLTVQILDSVQKILGEDVLQILIEDKKEKDLTRYMQALEGAFSMDEKLNRLTDIRTSEGYMAEWEKDEEGYLFIENNCPICLAATQCGNFCQAEIDNIQKLLGEKIQIERTGHTAKGDRRCIYRIR